MIPRDYLKHINYGILLPALLLSLTGLLTMYGIAWNLGRMTGDLDLFTKQLVWFVGAVIVGFFATLLDYKLWSRASWVIYLINIVLLVTLIFLGRKAHGAASWFNIGGMKFQPSELAKLFFIITFADFLSRYRDTLNTWPTLALAFGQFFVPFGLILLQPDMGTGLVFLAVFYSMIFVAGVDMLRVVTSIAVFVSFGVAAGSIVLKEYQIQRLATFINPAGDPRGSGYQLLQSKIAIGSGGLFGKGLFHSTQGPLGFLPAAHTDFIFSSMAEQWGSIGVIVVMLTFCVMLYRMLRVASGAEDLFAVFIVSGVFSMLAFQTLVNIGMSVGLFPITGIPLPFVSYGGSSLISNYLCIGLILNVSFRRRRITFF
jgi:rod shape determining protein RodA